MVYLFCLNKGILRKAAVNQYLTVLVDGNGSTI